MDFEIALLLCMSLATLIVILAFFVLILIYLSTSPYPELNRSESEKVFLNPDSNEMVAFPFGLSVQHEVELSIIIPAYNEALRLPSMLDETLCYLQNRSNLVKKISFEVIIVDDGSTDNTYDVAVSYTKKFTAEVVRVMKFPKNRGKGAAVRAGMLSARGRLLLFVDADGATKFSELEKLEAKLLSLTANKWNGSMAVICGSRAHLEQQAIAKRHPLRNLLMYGFHFGVWLLCVRGVRDTQCGFKLFSRAAARVLFPNQHVERWAFDVDLLYLAKQLNIELCEVPVCWHEVSGSKLAPFSSSIQMAKDLVLIRLRYALGAWKIEPSHHLD